MIISYHSLTESSVFSHSEIKTHYLCIQQMCIIYLLVPVLD